MTGGDRPTDGLWEGRTIKQQGAGILLAAHSLGLVRYLIDCIYSQQYSPPFFHCYFSFIQLFIAQDWL